MFPLVAIWESGDNKRRFESGLFCAFLGENTEEIALIHNYQPDKPSARIMSRFRRAYSKSRNKVSSPASSRGEEAVVQRKETNTKARNPSRVAVKFKA